MPVLVSETEEVADADGLVRVEDQTPDEVLQGALGRQGHGQSAHAETSDQGRDRQPEPLGGHEQVASHHHDGEDAEREPDELRVQRTLTGAGVADDELADVGQNNGDQPGDGQVDDQGEHQPAQVVGVAGQSDEPIEQLLHEDRRCDDRQREEQGPEATEPLRPVLPGGPPAPQAERDDGEHHRESQPGEHHRPLPDQLAGDLRPRPAREPSGQRAQDGRERPRANLVEVAPLPARLVRQVLHPLEELLCAPGGPGREEKLAGPVALRDAHQDDLGVGDRPLPKLLLRDFGGTRDLRHRGKLDAIEDVLEHERGLHREAVGHLGRKLAGVEAPDRDAEGLTEGRVPPGEALPGRVQGRAERLEGAPGAGPVGGLERMDALGERGRHGGGEGTDQEQGRDPGGPGSVKAPARPFRRAGCRERHGCGSHWIKEG